MRSTAPKKILVVRFSSIGDIVLTFPVVSAIKSLFPECKVDFATKKQFATLLEACPQIDQVFLLQDSLTALRQQIDFKHYDAIFDLHHNLRTRLLLFASRVPVYRFPKNNIEKWLLTSFSVVPKQRKPVIERYLEPLRQIAPSFAPFHAKLEYIIPQEAQFDISARFELQSKTYIAVAIGAQFATKRLPTDLLINLIGQLESPVLLLGGKEDTSTAQLILQNTATQKVYSAVGQTNIHESAWLVQNAKALVTHDTGLMHIGAAFDLPIHVIWGNTVKDFGMYPYRLEQEDVFHYEVADLACRPCSKIGHEQCPKGHFACMRKQDLSQIASRLRRTTF
jgi:ADP-heptose:LPS heptosyltransferase